MSSRRVFVKQNSYSSSIYWCYPYFANRKPKASEALGRVGKVGDTGWVATPGSQEFGAIRVVYRTRHEAGEALDDYRQTGNRALIWGDESADDE